MTSSSTKEDDDVDSLVEEEEVYDFGDEEQSDADNCNHVNADASTAPLPTSVDLLRRRRQSAGPVFKRYDGEDFSTYIEEEGEAASGGGGLDTINSTWRVDMATKGDLYEIREPEITTTTAEASNQEQTTSAAVEITAAPLHATQKRSTLAGTLKKIKRMVKGKKAVVAGSACSVEETVDTGALEYAKQSGLRNISFSETKIGSMMLKEEELQMSKMSNDQADSGIGIEPDINNSDLMTSHEANWWNLSTLARDKKPGHDSLSSSEGGFKKQNKKSKRISSMFQSSATTQQHKLKQLPTTEDIDNSIDCSNHEASHNQDLPRKTATAEVVEGDKNFLRAQARDTGKLIKSILGGKNGKHELSASSSNLNAPVPPPLRPEGFGGAWRKVTDTLSRRRRSDSDGSVISASSLSYNKACTDVRV